MYSDPLIGKQLANFRIDRLLGRGGMGKVYLGWDYKLEREVAIKVIDDRFRDNEAYTRRFMREARMVATWQHPNVLQIYYAGQEDGLYYYVMEYIRGQNLQQILRSYAQRRQLPSYAEVLRIANAIASALDYAHQRNVIHRDVKPSNVLVTEDGRVVLTDFGLAVNLSEGTQGEVFGSPHYMSPEQARNSSYAVPQSDLYSLGVILYEMLTGSLPFNDPSPAALALQQITLAPPSPRLINPRLNAETEAFLMKALAKDPRQRYQTGQSMMDALEQAIKTTPQPLVQHDVAETQPATMPFLPVDMPALDARPTQPETITITDPFHPQPAAVKPGSIPKRAQGPTRPWLPGCAVLVLLGLLLVGVALASSSGRLALGFNPTSAVGLIKPSATQTHPTQANSPGNISSPTTTDAPTSTPEPTDTPGPTPTASATPPPGDTNLILVTTKHTDNLVLINAGPADLPLSSIELVKDQTKIEGTWWGLDYLKSGQCVVLLGTDQHPGKMNGLKCDLVGKVLQWNQYDIFWNNNLQIYYNGNLAGTCPTLDQGCTLPIKAGQ